jgi:hypothetical protein
VKRLRRVTWGLTVTACCWSALALPPSAGAFGMTSQSPTNGHVVFVRGKGTWVDFSFRVDTTGCYKGYGTVESALDGPFVFKPLNGHGPGFEEVVWKGDHSEWLEPYVWVTPGDFIMHVAAFVEPFQVAKVRSGQLMRWTMRAWCAVSTTSGSGYTYASASGTVRIVKPGRAGSPSGSTGSVPPGTKPPGKKPPAKKPAPRKPRHPIPFRITRIDSPASVLQNGSRGIATIHWSGRPTFPVTMHDAPASCPAGFTCTGETSVATQRANPLTWAAWWCAGSETSNWTLDFWFWLTDAKGQRTQKVRQQVTCDVG